LAHPCGLVLTLAEGFVVQLHWRRWIIGLALGALGAGAVAAELSVGSLAPDFSLPQVQGGNVRLSEYRGQVVVLAFFSSRCATCAAQLSALNEQQLTYGPAGLVALAVSVDDDMQRAHDYAAAHAAKVPLLLDARRSVGRSFQISRLPTTVLIDRRGHISQWLTDYHRIDNSYISQLRALLDDAQAVTTPIR
jgi:peroxiredoxin